MNPLRYLRPVSSAPVALQRLHLLLDYERRTVDQDNLIALLREDIVTVVSLYAKEIPHRVQVKVDHGAMMSRLAVYIEISNRSHARTAVSA
jgi:cell division topological specificity factor